ncbi:MAG TPA: hypothetical protein VFQ05_12640 [Candidatus Eisenbacteria bacterium]|nr:hypothetical protein [Candidatus Eisenbacteria bacterium]
MLRFSPLFARAIAGLICTVVLGCSPSRSIAPEVRDTRDVVTSVVTGAAATFLESIPLPVDFVPEGIATTPGGIFYVGSLKTGDIYRGDVRTGEGDILVDALPGQVSVGMKVSQGLLFVAGGPTGKAFVYDARTGDFIREVQFGTPGSTLLNDVIVTRDAAYFTDSFQPVLYRIPIGPGGELGTGSTLAITGPAATVIAGAPNLNGIEATHNRLIVNHTALGALFTVDPVTGASAPIEVEGLAPNVMDGMLLEGRSLWIVENFANRVIRVTLSPGFSSGEITATITSPLFRVPTTVGKVGGRLALVNARFDLGLPPPFGPGQPPGTEYDVVIVSSR